MIPIFTSVITASYSSLIAAQSIPGMHTEYGACEPRRWLDDMSSNDVRARKEHSTQLRPRVGFRGLGHLSRPERLSSRRDGTLYLLCDPRTRKWCRSLGFPESQMQPATCTGQDRYLNS